MGEPQESKEDECKEDQLETVQEVFSSLGLFREHKGKSFHIQYEWKGIHLVGKLQASKEDQ